MTDQRSRDRYFEDTREEWRVDGLTISKTSGSREFGCSKVLSQLYGSRIDTEHGEGYTNVLKWTLIDVFALC